MSNPNSIGGRNSGRTGRSSRRTANPGRGGRGSSATPPSSAGSNRNNTANSRGGSRNGSENERSGRGGRTGGKTSGRGRGRGRGNNQKVDVSKMTPAEKYKYLESKMNAETRIKREKAAKVIQSMARSLMQRIKLLKAYRKTNPGQSEPGPSHPVFYYGFCNIVSRICVFLKVFNDFSIMFAGLSNEFH